MKFSLSVILDTLFCAFISFILLFILFNYYFILSVALTLSITLSLIIGMFVFIYLKKKKTAFNLSKKNRQNLDIMVNQLSLYSKKEQLSVLKTLLNKLSTPFEERKDFLYIKEKGLCLFTLFSFDQITKTDIVKIFNTISKEDLAYIFASDYSPEIISFASRFDGRIILVKKQDFYKILLKNDCLPKQKFPFEKNNKLKLSDLSRLLLKENSKKQFWFGLLFLIMSFFVYFKIYYIVIGCLFLVLSLVSRLFGVEKKAVV